MNTERDFLSQSELTPEELENVADVTEYLLNSIQQSDVFNHKFDPSQPSLVLEYNEEIENLPFDYREKNIEGFEKPYLGDIFWGDDKGVFVETIKFSTEDNDIRKKHLYFSIIEASQKLNLFNQETIHSPSYKNFSKAIEYLSKEITSKESLRNFLENPGYSFVYDDRGQYSFPTLRFDNKKISFHRKNVNLSKKEKVEIEDWEYIEIFELLKFAPIVDSNFRISYISKIVGNSLRSLEGGKSYKKLFTHFNYKNSSVLMIITQEGEV